jgi:hypothetical protein
MRRGQGIVWVLFAAGLYRMPGLRDKIGMFPMEPASLVMERKMLQGIKQRAESSRTREPGGTR